ncbi:MAG: glycoside hydrolase family 38 C-terminal domain-containing protein [SAR202 cluster bacterium]|jgi:alpha-mannosidase|nr:glycoside hydrolase family 38 C-terminal domain-containing protein [SAR202 cluster bacterium]
MYTDFRLTVPRLRQRIEELRHAVVRDREKITSWRAHDGDLDDGQNPTLDDSAWPALESWDVATAPAWYRARFTVPQRFDGKPVSLSLRVGGYLHSLFNAEALVYIDGDLAQGLDAFHYDIPLSESAEGGREYVVALYLFWKPDFDVTEWLPSPGREYPALDAGTELQVIDHVAEEFYWDAATAFEAAEALGDDSVDQVRIITAVDRAITAVDYRGPLDNAFYESAAAAGETLRAEIYSAGPPKNGATALAVGQTHIDLAWFWPIDVNRFKIGRSVATILDLMNRYPELTFMQNQAKVYEYCKEDFPELYAAVKERIAEGRWEVNGAMWTEPDCNMPSGESLIRQITFGLRFFREEFGSSGEALVVMDAFGYSWALPQLLRRSGVKYFLTNKMSWSQFNRLPYDSFNWRGIDGSTVLTHQLTARSPGRAGWMTTCNAVLSPEMLAGAWGHYQQKDKSDQILFTYGYGDGGGGPTTQMLERARRVSKLGLPVKIEHGTVQGYFEELEERLGTDRAPEWSDELYLELHRGTYTSKGIIKRGNRKGEVVVHDAELYGAMATVLVGAMYPRENIREAWDRLLVNQQHDILPGSITRDPENDAIADYARVQKLAGQVVVDATATIAEQVKTDGDTLVVFNPASWSRTDVVRFSPDSLPAQLQLADSSGQVVPHQISASPADAGDLLVQMSEVPSCGYASISMGSSASEETAYPITVTESAMENRFFHLELDGQGRITSIFDKFAEREVLAPGEAGNVFQLFEDKPIDYDAWDIDLFAHDKVWEMDGTAEVRVLETGPVRGTVEIRRAFSHSTLVQRIHVYDATSRIDFDTEVEWHERHTLLKVAFPVDVNATDATYEIQFGSIQRPLHRSTPWDQARFEVSAQKWADLSEGDYGVSLLNDCKYGYDVKDNVMRLSLLRSPTQPDPETDQGHHQFTYSLYPHSGDWRNGATRAGFELNYPMTVVRTGTHEGTLPQDMSLVSSSRDGVFVETIKLAEDSDRLVLRCYEGHNMRGRAELQLGVGVGGAFEVNLLEEDEGPVGVDNADLTFDVAPFQVRTFAIETATPD